MPEDRSSVWMNVGGRTFLLREARDVTPREMSDLSLPPSRAADFIAGISPGVEGVAVYNRKYVSPPSPRIPRLSHKDLWRLGRSYADFTAPLVVEQARLTSHPLPVRAASEVFDVLRDVHALLEHEHGVAWKDLLEGQKNDFLTGFWNRLREKGVLEE
jgi:hypothetical protein